MTKLEEKLKELKYIKEPNFKKTNIEYYSKNFNDNMEFKIILYKGKLSRWESYIINSNISERSLSHSKMVFEQEIEELREVKDND